MRPNKESVVSKPEKSEDSSSSFETDSDYSSSDDSGNDAKFQYNEKVAQTGGTLDQRQKALN